MEISFVMLTWNRKEFVRLNMESFYKNISGNYDYEFLIIDNGSNDGTAELLQYYEQKDKCLKITYNTTNEGLQAYKKLFNCARGNYIIELDDDVIEYPKNFDAILIEAKNTFKNVGMICSDVVQNEYTNGAKPGPENYTAITKGDYTIEIGPCGGWCTIFKRSSFNLIKFFYNKFNLDMKHGEDGLLRALFNKLLFKKSGVLKDLKVFHACGPYYSKKYGYLKRDIQKYKDAGLTDFVDTYQNLEDK
jgi:glycosyltransferase involved in cell wall biosynthesis